MRPQRTLILVGLAVLLLTCLSILLFSTIRMESSQPTPVSNTGVTSTGTAAAAGVILAHDAASYEWDGLAGEYVETTVSGSRVIVFDRLNATDRPGVTLEQVVSAMIERGARYVFIASGIQGGASLAETYPDAVFILNQSARASVESLLIALNAAALQSGTAATPPPEITATLEAERTSRASIVLTMALALLLLTGALVGVVWLRQDPGQVKAKEQVSFFVKTYRQALTLGLGRSKPKAKRPRSGGPHGRALMIEQTVQARATDFAALGEPEPVVHKLSTYVHGDVHYDESFPIELDSGAFLGECGVSIAAPVNLYDAGRVAAFEVWLFDKNDIRTATAFLVSEHGASNSVIQGVLAGKGGIVQAGVDEVVELETRTLRLRARVLTMEYGFSDTLPLHSFFDYVVVELAAWQKQA